VIVLVGTLDDLRDLGHHSKFLAQIAAAGLMLFWGGEHLHSLGNLVGAWPLGLGVYSIPLSFVAVVGVVGGINAVNFSDGADGLAHGLTSGAGVQRAVVVLRAWAVRAAGRAARSFTCRITRRRGADRLCVSRGGSRVSGLQSAPAGTQACARLPGRCGEPRPGPGLALAWFTVSGAEGSTPLFAPVTAIWLLAVPLVDTRHAGLHRAPAAERHQPVQGRSQASAPHPHRPGAARGPGEWRWR